MVNENGVENMRFPTSLFAEQPIVIKAGGVTIDSIEFHFQQNYTYVVFVGVNCIFKRKICKRFVLDFLEQIVYLLEFSRKRQIIISLQFESKFHTLPTLPSDFRINRKSPQMTAK